MKEFANASIDEVEAFHAKIAANIKRIRKEKGMSQLDLAHTIGLGSVTFYTNAENCKNGKHFNVEHIYKIAKAFGVEVASLCREEVV